MTENEHVPQSKGENDIKYMNPASQQPTTGFQRMIPKDCNQLLTFIMKRTENMR